ncbi:unnamed protein product [Amoebophrya sp. A25]|nr:unnamed protein product [Amoebophrya sp. A25]|eukprot:GSA25T00004277001.1
MPEAEVGLGASREKPCPDCGVFFHPKGLGRHRGSEKCRARQRQRALASAAGDSNTVVCARTTSRAKVRPGVDTPKHCSDDSGSKEPEEFSDAAGRSTPSSPDTSPGDYGTTQLAASAASDQTQTAPFEVRLVRCSDCGDFFHPKGLGRHHGSERCRVWKAKNEQSLDADGEGGNAKGDALSVDRKGEATCIPASGEKPVVGDAKREEEKRALLSKAASASEAEEGESTSRSDPNGATALLVGIDGEENDSASSRDDAVARALAEKFSLVVKPTQSGKTFELIQTILADDSECSCHIVFTMNTLMNNEQCAVRLANKWVEEKGGQAARREVVMIASKAAENLPCRVEKKWEDFLFCTTLSHSTSERLQRPRVIVLCTHSSRLSQIYSFLATYDLSLRETWPLEKRRKALGCFAHWETKFHIHHDELHYYCDRNHVELEIASSLKEEGKSSGRCRPQSGGVPRWSTLINAASDSSSSSPSRRSTSSPSTTTKKQKEETTMKKKLHQEKKDSHLQHLPRLRTCIEQVCVANSSVVRVSGYTATPGPLLHESGPWSEVRLKPFTHGDDAFDPDGRNQSRYHGTACLDFFALEEGENMGPEEFAAFVLKAFRKEIFPEAALLSCSGRNREEDSVGLSCSGRNSNSSSNSSNCTTAPRVFIPASPKILTHNEIRSQIFGLCPKAVVVVLNGEEKSVSWFPQQDWDVGGAEYSYGTRKAVVDLGSFCPPPAPGDCDAEDGDGVKKATSSGGGLGDGAKKARAPNPAPVPLEVADKIALVVKKYGLQERPVCITGYLCLGMGQTLLNTEKMGNFTHAILPARDKMQKLFMSVTPEVLYQEAGRITGRGHRNRTRIFCPPSIRDNFMQEEGKALAAMERARDDSYPVLRWKDVFGKE